MLNAHNEIMTNCGLRLEKATNLVKPRENPNFLKKGKIVISVKIRNFSRSWMMKRTTPLESSREI